MYSETKTQLLLFYHFLFLNVSIIPQEFNFFEASIKDNITFTNKNEKVDIKKDSNYKDYVKSKLVLFPTFQMIRHGVYIGSLIIIFAIIGIDEAEINLVIYWAIIGLLVEIPLTVYIINLTKKSFSLKINLLSISKYLITTIIIFGLILMNLWLWNKLYVLEQTVDRHEKILEKDID